MSEEQFAAFICLLCAMGAIDDRNRGHFISSSILLIGSLAALSQVVWLHFKGAV